VPLPETGPPDTTLWAAGRVTDYETSVVVDKRVPQALLRIPAIDLAVPLLEGIDEITLNRGVGRIPGMARKIADGGNFGIAGHRDGYFRGLKDIGVGDTIEVLTLTDTFSYRVDDISIIGKNDLSVLQPTDNQVLTLVTCYPFYFVGHAPKRYIVKAVLEQQDTRT
jgi:sortase A